MLSIEPMNFPNAPLIESVAIRRRTGE